MEAFDFSTAGNQNIKTWLFPHPWLKYTITDHMNLYYWTTSLQPPHIFIFDAGQPYEVEQLNSAQSPFHP